MPLKDLLFSFDGRIRRSQWWAVHLSIMAAMIVLIGLFAGALIAYGRSETGPVIGVTLGLILLVTSPFTLWISLATGVKRFHDQGLSGWMVLIGFIPAIGWLLSLIFLGCIDGQPHSNLYGPSPKFPERMAPTFA